MIGSAYGIVISVENIGLSIGPLLVAAAHTRSYVAVSVLNFFEALIGTGFAGYLLWYDYKHSQVLLANSKTAVVIQRSERSKPKVETNNKVPLQFSM